MSTPAWPDPLALARAWGRAVTLAPKVLTQSILPWTWAPSLTVNHHNSAAPETEVEVLQEYSYGRQLGRISDVLACLLDEREGRPVDPAHIADFRRMKGDIDRIKDGAAAARRAQLKADLEALRREDPERFAALLRDLGETP